MDSHRYRRSARSSTRAKINNLDALLADLTCGNDALAETAMHKLVAFGTEAVSALRELANSPDSDVRWWAISTLAQIDDADVDWFLAALDDESGEVKQAVVLGLTARPYPKAAPALLDFLQHSDSMLRSLAMNALVALGTDATLALLGFLESHTAQDAARLSAVRAIASIADKRAIPALMAALEEDSALIRHWAEEGLEKLGLDMVYMKLD